MKKMILNWSAAALTYIVILGDPTQVSSRHGGSLLRRSSVSSINVSSRRGTRKADRCPHSEFSRIRNAQLGRFTLDRMIAILGKLDEDIEKYRLPSGRGSG